MAASISSAGTGIRPCRQPQRFTSIQTFISFTLAYRYIPLIAPFDLTWPVEGAEGEQPGPLVLYTSVEPGWAVEDRLLGGVDEVVGVRFDRLDVGGEHVMSGVEVAGPRVD